MKLVQVLFAVACLAMLTGAARGVASRPEEGAAPRSAQAVRTGSMGLPSSMLGDFGQTFTMLGRYTNKMPAGVLNQVRDILQSASAGSLTQAQVNTMMSQLTKLLMHHGLSNVQAYLQKNLSGPILQKALDLAEYLFRREQYRLSSKAACKTGSLPCVRGGEYCAETDGNDFRIPLSRSAGGRCMIKPDDYCDKYHPCKPDMVCNNDSESPAGRCIIPGVPLGIRTFEKALAKAESTSVKKAVNIHGKTQVPFSTDSLKEVMVNKERVRSAELLYKQKYHRFIHQHVYRTAFHGAGRADVMLSLDAQEQAGGKRDFFSLFTNRRAGPLLPECGNKKCDIPATRDQYKEDTPLRIRVRVHMLEGTAGISEDSVAAVLQSTVEFFRAYKIYIHFQIVILSNPNLVNKKIAKDIDLEDPEFCGITRFNANSLEVPENAQCVKYNVWATILHPNWMSDDVVSLFIGDQANTWRKGFAKFPWNGAEHGLVFMAPSMFNTDNVRVAATTLAHELGHTMGLLHTHEGQFDQDGCGPCGENYNMGAQARDLGGDMCSDTPPTPRNRQCRDPPGIDVCSSRRWAATGYDNLMGYGKECRSKLTPQQLRRARCWSDQGYRRIAFKPNKAAPSTRRSPIGPLSRGGVTRTNNEIHS
eukprot:TRINITY_DN13499_c0_g1_i1.p1 TRINITY_DN13499_c0_g1~~TRINITY_DN13499_c0_g1_i1.p1  ORF type:complete len:645 (+),score=122.19 TRINITY_DN13499_c0_g1_i1:89-2023(+)